MSRRYLLILAIYFNCISILTQQDKNEINTPVMINYGNQSAPFAKSLIQNVAQPEIICESPEIVGDEEIYWNVEVGNEMAADKHCLDKNNMFVLCHLNGNDLVRSTECAKVQQPLSSCPDGMMEGDEFCYIILKDVTYDQAVCPYEMVDDISFQTLIDPSESIWMPYQRVDGYGIGHFHLVALSNYGDPLMHLPFNPNIKQSNCVIWKNNNLYAASCLEKHTKVCLYKMRSFNNYCDTQSCINYKFQESHTHCICLKDAAELRCTPGKLIHPYMNLLKDIEEPQNCALFLSKNDHGVITWDQQEEINYGYWSHENIELDFGKYILTPTGWAFTRQTPDCKICEEIFEYKETSINIEKFIISPTEIGFEVHLYDLGNFLKEIICYTDGTKNELVDKIYFQGIETITIAESSGYYWCSALDIAFPKRIFSNKLLFIVDHNYPIEIVCRYGADPTLRFDLFQIYDSHVIMKWIKTLSIDEVSTTVRYLVHIAIPFNEFSYMDNFHQLDVAKILAHVTNITYFSELYNHEYCMEITEKIDEFTLTWSMTEFEKSVLSDKICLTDNGYEKRKCAGDYYIGARWQPVKPCRVVTEKSQYTDKLEGILKSNASVEEIIDELEAITANPIILEPVDVSLIATIVEKLNPEEVNLWNFTKIMSNLMMVDDTLKLAQINYNATDTLLSVFDSIILHHQLIDVEEVIETKNLLLYLSNAEYTKYAGIALINIPGGGYTMSLLDRNTTELEVAKIEHLKTAVLIPENLFNCITNNTISIAIHHTNALFTETNNNYKLVDINIGILLPNTCEESFEIALFFTPKNKLYRNMMSCGYWKYGEGRKGVWSPENRPNILSQNIYLCKHSHVTHFGLFISNNRLSKYIKSLDLVSTIETILSLIGLVAVITTAIAFRSWREKSNNELIFHYSIVSVMQIVLLYVADNTENNDQFLCGLTGSILHYTILFQFNMMFIFAVKLFNKYVMIYEAHYYCLRLNLITNYVLPLIPTLSLTAVFPTSYQKSEINFCYPTGLGLVVFTLLPIGLVIVVNLIIYCLMFRAFFVKVKYEQTRAEMLRKVVLMVVGFFLLGITWTFGLLAEVLQDYTLLFIFCTLASIQGFVIFCSVIVFDGSVRGLYWRCLNKGFHKM